MGRQAKAIFLAFLVVMLALPLVVTKDEIQANPVSVSTFTTTITLPNGEIKTVEHKSYAVNTYLNIKISSSVSAQYIPVISIVDIIINIINSIKQYLGLIQQLIDLLFIMNGIRIFIWYRKSMKNVYTLIINKFS